MFFGSWIRQYAIPYQFDDILLLTLHPVVDNDVAD